MDLQCFYVFEWICIDFLIFVGFHGFIVFSMFFFDFCSFSMKSVFLTGFHKFWHSPGPWVLPADLMENCSHLRFLTSLVALISPGKTSFEMVRIANAWNLTSRRGSLRSKFMFLVFLTWFPRSSPKFPEVPRSSPKFVGPIWWFEVKPVGLRSNSWFWG